MPVIHPLRRDLIEFLTKHGLTKKWEKAKKLFIANPRHSSLRTELLEPRHNLVYSFRIDKKFRALFLVRDDETIEVFKITNHYR